MALFHEIAKFCFGYNIQAERMTNDWKFYNSLAKQEEFINTCGGFQRHFIPVGRRLKQNATKALRNAKQK